MTRPRRIDLPGLIGDEPLGFLAAMALERELMITCWLSWDPQDRHAILHCDDSVSGIDDLVDILLRRLDGIKPGWAIPYQTDFPLPRRRGGPDPLRMRPAEFQERDLRRHKGGLAWLKATLTAADTDADGFCLVNPLIAVRGRQTIGSFWYYPMLEVKRDPRRLLTEALTGWRRVEGADGWLLDHRATYSADPGLRGPGGSMAVPGATWLATLAVERFGYTGDSIYRTGGRLPWGWYQVGGRNVFLWPLWSLPARGTTLDEVWSVGWRSGDWELTKASDGALQACISTTHAVDAPNGVYHFVDFGIFTMCAAARPAEDGPLTPVPVRTCRKPRKYNDDVPAWKGWDWNYPRIDHRD
jgi:hypothetical protein